MDQFYFYLFEFKNIQIKKAQTKSIKKSYFISMGYNTVTDNVLNSESHVLLCLWIIFQENIFACGWRINVPHIHKFKHSSSI